MSSAYFGAHGDCDHEYEGDLQMDARGLLGACLEEHENEHAYALEPVDGGWGRSGRVIEIAGRRAIAMSGVPPPGF